MDVPIGREEHVRRLAEVAHLFLDAGLILIVSGMTVSPADLEVVKVPVNPESLFVIQVGSAASRVGSDLIVEDASPDVAIPQIKRALRQSGAIFSPF
jgi:bifunctional enzyme CysN/CysC